MFRRLLLALVLGLVLPATVWSAFDKGGVLGVGARPMGLGGAFVAIADDSTAIHWNPAGLIQLPRMEGSLFFAPLLNGKEYYMSGAFAMPFLEQTALGISVVSLFHDTGNADTQAFENIYIASVATPLNVEKTVSFGVNIKFLQFDSAAHATYTPAGGQAQTIEAKASALGMDLGGLYQILLASHGKKINVGFLAQDLDTVLNWQSGVTERVPLYLQTGLACAPVIAALRPLPTASPAASAISRTGSASTTLTWAMPSIWATAIAWAVTSPLAVRASAPAWWPWSTPPPAWACGPTTTASSSPGKPIPTRMSPATRST